MTNTEKIKKIRDITLSPINKISEALTKTNGDVDAAIKFLIDQKQVDAVDIAKRTADNNIVYSYVHNNKIGAMIVLASQTDFASKNEVFLNLAKDICIQIVSSPVSAEYISNDDIPEELLQEWRKQFYVGLENKPPHIVDKIMDGKLSKKMNEISLLNQPFVKNGDITIAQLIADVSSTLGEKIEVKHFVRISTNAQNEYK